MKNLFVFIFFSFPFLLTAQSPNFVFILADDMGWNGTSIQISPSVGGSMSDYYETDNLQLLAAAGMTFSQGYAPAPKCSPTRCSILTGESTARNSFTESGNGIASGKILIEASTVNEIPTSDITIAEWLKSTGLNYRTAHYGKWHLNASGPSNNGFDFDDGSNGNNDGNGANGNTVQDDPKKITDLTDKGILFMQNAVTDGVPFYLQISHYAVHGSVETTQASLDHFIGKTPGTVHDDEEYAGMTRDLDDGIGLIMDEIENLGIAGQTYIIFLSDNGAPNNLSSNSPLLNGKNYLNEGGIRVPLIIKGPNVPANSHCPTAAVGYDLFPTIAELTGSGTALPSTLDGESLVPLLQQNTLTRSEPIYFHSPHYVTNPGKTPRSAAVDGNYKLIIEYETGIDYLHDLDTDIEELTNIAAANPTIVNDLKVKLRDHLKSVNANMPSLDPVYFGSSSTTDVDNDGLPDEWEFTELLSFNHSANSDPDGDGDDNLTEYNNGTDPLVDGGGGGNTVTIINSGGFETGWEIWNDGGSDCRRRIADAAYANSGSYCVRLRDNDPLSSFMTTDVLDLSAYDDLTIDFSYYVSGFESGEDFLLEFSTDGGANYTTIEDWVNTVDFVNDERHDPSLAISGPFTSNCTLRFRCDASQNNDIVYLDDVVIKGTTSASSPPLPNLPVVEHRNATSDQFASTLADMRLFPNPVTDHLTVEFVSAEAAEIQLVIFDLLGKILVKKEWTADAGRQQMKLDAEGLPEGSYIIQLITENGRLSDKVIVIK